MYERQSCLEPPWPGPVPGLQQSCRGAPASVEALARRESCHIATDKQNAHAKRKNKGSRTVTPQNTHTRRRPRLTVISLRVMFPTLLFHPATQPAPAPLTESISSCVTRGDTRASALLPLSAAQNPTAHSAIHRITQLDIISQRPPRRRTSSSSLQSSFARKKTHTHTHIYTLTPNRWLQLFVVLFAFPLQLEDHFLSRSLAQQKKKISQHQKKGTLFLLARLHPARRPISPAGY